MASPLSPKLLKGAIVSYRLPSTKPSVIAFQYNPETVTRALKARAMEGEGDSAESFRLTGAPEETITMDVEFDAVDGLEADDSDTVEYGIHPQLAALETLIYPRSADVIRNSGLLNMGTLEIIPNEAPFTLLVWGARRVLPVRLSEFSITEEAFDTNLNPIRAKVSLSLRVLSYNDLPASHAGYHLFMAHQTLKESLASKGTNDDVSAALGSNAKLI